MKTRVFTITAVALLAGLTVLSSCEKDDDDDNNNNPPADFVADDDSFKDFANWPLEATAQGPDPALGPAHGGNDNTVTRNMYFKSGQDPVNGMYLGCHTAASTDYIFSNQ